MQNIPHTAVAPIRPPARPRSGLLLTEKRHFGPELFLFLKELRENNHRDWFLANKERYEEHVRNPMLRFIADFAPILKKLSPHFLADPRPVGGSLFRIYRDTRFSRDKSPYKTAAAAHFPHIQCGRGVHAPGFYLHLEPGDCMGGGGLWHPDAAALTNVRNRIVNHTKEWKAIRDRGIAIEGDSLERPPRGYDQKHPFIQDLKRKDFYTMTEFSEKEACAPDFMDRFTESCRTAAPLMEFLTRALDTAW